MVPTVNGSRRPTGPATISRVLGVAVSGALEVAALDPTTLVYFAAVVLGNHDLVDGAAQGTVSVAAALAMHTMLR